MREKDATGGERSLAGAISRRLTYANVMSTVAVFGVLAGGSAWAHGKIGSNQLKRNAVATKHIKTKAVKAGKLAPRSVKTRKIALRAQGVAVAGLTANSDGSVRSWFNRFGGEPVVNKSATLTGRYTVTIPGVDINGFGDSPAIATVSLNRPASASPGPTGQIHRDGRQVLTADSSGTPADRAFDFIVIAPG